MNKFFRLSLWLLAITPLLFAFTGDPTKLPKFVWIFFCVILLFAAGIKDRLFSYRNTFIIPAGLLLIWYILTLSRCVNIFEGFRSIFILILFITLYISLENLIARDIYLIDYFMKGVVIITVIISIYGLLQVAGIDFVKWDIKNSPLSTLGRRNFAAEYLVMVIPYVYYFIFKEKRNWLLYILLLLFILHLIFTFTRASYISFFVSCILFFILTGRRVSINRKVIIFLCILFFSRIAFSDISTFERGTIKSRFLIWNVTLKMIKENPLMGVGPGNFVITYPYYAKGETKALKGPSLLVDSVHNDYLEVCAETGVVGLLLFLYLLFSFFRVSFVLYRGMEGKERVLIAGIISSVVAICVNALASFPFKNPATLLLFWANVSFTGGIYRKSRGDRTLKVSYPLLKLYLLIFAIGGIVLSYRGIKASRYMFLAKNTKGNLSLQFAEKASKYNPFSYEYLHFAGTIAMNLNEYNRAYTLLSAGIKLHPYYDSLYNNLGLTYLFRGNSEKAEESFLTALMLTPDSYEFNNNMGFLYLNTARYDEAIQYLKRATWLKPDAYISFYSLGTAYYMKRQYREAEEQFKKALEINPDFSPAKEYLEKLSR